MACAINVLGSWICNCKLHCSLEHNLHSFTVLAPVITIVNYDRKTFIVQATWQCHHSKMSVTCVTTQSACDTVAGVVWQKKCSNLQKTAVTVKCAAQRLKAFWTLILPIKPSALSVRYQVIMMSLPPMHLFTVGIKNREPFVELKLKHFIWQVTVLKPLKRNRMEQENVNNRALSPTRWCYQSQV